MSLKVQTADARGIRVDIKEFREGIHYDVLPKKKMKSLVDVWFFWNGKWHFIAAGFIWNGASIPEAFWFFIGCPTEQKFALASMIHDFLYAHLLNRQLADEAFRELLDWAGVNGRRTALMFWAVRSAGWLYYF